MTQETQLSRRGFITSLLAAPLAIAAVTTVTAEPAQARGGPDPDERPGPKAGKTRSRKRKYMIKLSPRRGHIRRSIFGHWHFSRRRFNHGHFGRGHRPRFKKSIHFGRRNSFPFDRGR